MVFDLSRNEFQFRHPLDSFAVNGGHIHASGRDMVRSYQSVPDSQLQIANYYGIESDSVHVHNGAVSALNNIFAGIKMIDRSATLLLPSLGWDFYGRLSEHYDLVVDTYRYRANGDGWEVDFRALVDILPQVENPVVLLNSPSNPLGRSEPFESIQVLAEAISKRGGWLVLDRAYSGFDKFEDEAYKDGHVLENLPSTILVGSMSKFFGMPGVRVGYTLATPATQKAFKLPYDYLGFNSFSDELTVACFNRQSEFELLADEMVRIRERMIDLFNATDGFEAFPSSANFVLVRSHNPGRHKLLEEYGIKVRSFDSPQELTECFRITVPNEEGFEVLRSAVGKIVETDLVLDRSGSGGLTIDRIIN